MSNQEFIPVYLITGFLESGKTTLISGMLADEDFTRRSAGGKQKTLVIVCEEGMEEYDEAALVKETVEVALQINGKLRGRMDVPADLSREAANDYFMALDEVKKLIGDKSVRKLIFVPGRLVNIVVG